MSESKRLRQQRDEERDRVDEVTEVNDRSFCTEESYERLVSPEKIDWLIDREGGSVGE